MGMELETYNNNNNHMVNIKEDDVELSDSEFSDSDLVAYIRDALKSVSDSGFENYTNHYSQLIGIFSNSQRLTDHEVALLVASLKALSKAVSYIDIDYHNGLIQSILDMSLWNYGTDVMDALIEVIKSLAVSSGKLVERCLEMLVRNFVPPKSFLQLLSQDRGIDRKEQVLHRVHSALVDISYLVPLFPLAVCKIVPRGMPRMTSKSIFLQENELYVENMLKLESGLLGKYLGHELLSEVVFRLVELDVEIEWDEILLDDPSKGIFDMELEDIDELEESEENGPDHPKAGFGLQKKLGADIYAEKLDKLMVLTCEYIKSCADSGRLIEVFESLLRSFQHSILNAYKSKFAQFIMFYACSLDPDTCGVRFAVTLADTFVHGASLRDRMSAVAYLSSYLSRGRFVPYPLVVSILKRLVDCCAEYYRKLQTIEEKRINPQIHKLFYSGCQAVMYILCFRMRPIMDIPHLKSQLLHMHLQFILQNPLDPLKVCLPSIVTEFLRQAKSAKLFEVHENNDYFNDLLESDLSKTYGGIERFDTFFPFDPCLLKNCDRYIRPNFFYWSMVKTSYNDENSDEEINEDDDFDDGNGRNYEDEEIDLDEFENSMNRMSITPNRIPTRMMPARIRPSVSPESI
ncbi:hypothetical protein ACHQM5_024176 [Ranunculus cassubicifolius]